MFAGSSRRHALLAQLVEHFHGKEGVAGSSPAEGFQTNRVNTATFPRRLHHPDGGVSGVSIARARIDQPERPERAETSVTKAMALGAAMRPLEGPSRSGGYDQSTMPDREAVEAWVRRNEAARAEDRRRDLERSMEERLEEAVRLSRIASELEANLGHDPDVRAR